MDKCTGETSSSSLSEPLMDSSVCPSVALDRRGGPAVWFPPQTESVSHLMLVVRLDLQLPLLPQQLLDSALDGVPEFLQHVVTLLLLLVLIVFLMTVEVMDVITIMPVLLLVVLVVAVLDSK